MAPANRPGMGTEAAPVSVVIGESICPYCGVGCRLRLEESPGQPLRVRGVENAPANRGRLCVKGAQLIPTRETKDRLTQPLMRRSRNACLQPVSWDAALEFVAQRMRYLMGQHGPESVGFYGSGQLDTESLYVANKLFKGHLGTNHTDTNSRLCMAAAEAGYRSSLGADGPPPCYDDIELADTVLIIGSNLAETHPVLFDRLRASKQQKPQTKIIVVDPRKTATCAIANLHLPIRPGGDIAFLNLVGRFLIESNKLDPTFVHDHTRDFDHYRHRLGTQSIGDLLPATGLTEESIRQVTALISNAKAFLSLYCMGMNQSSSGVWKNNSLINLHLLTGQIGKPGCGPFSLTGQPNAMGVRETGLAPDSLPGHRKVYDAEHRRELETYWNLPPGRIAIQPGLTAVEMFQRLEHGDVKAIWIAATNPMVSLPELHQVRRAFSRSELIVLNEVYHPTETSRLADVVLPVAQWGEKDWTSTNGERRVSFSRKLGDAPGACLPDWEVFSRFARKMNFAGFEYTCSGQIWDEYIQLTRNQPCDMSGMSANRLNEVGSLQWPCPTEEHPGTERLYREQTFPTPDGRAIFQPRDHRDPKETPDADFPFVLTSGRVYGHWHTLTRTGKVPALMSAEPKSFVEIHPDDALELGVADGEMIQLTTRRGTIQLPARFDTGISLGTVFVPFHWGDLFGEGNALNYLTTQTFGDLSKQPDLKSCAVQLSKGAMSLPRYHEEARFR